MDRYEAGGERRRPVAVALKADPAMAGTSGNGRPTVVARGHGAIAEQILRIAFDRGIKVREDRDLAEILAAIEIDSPIPLAALAAVAEILSYLYRNQNMNQGAASMEYRP